MSLLFEVTDKITPKAPLDTQIVKKQMVEPKYYEDEDILKLYI